MPLSTTLPLLAVRSSTASQAAEWLPNELINDPESSAVITPCFILENP